MNCIWKSAIIAPVLMALAGCGADVPMSTAIALNDIGEVEQNLAMGGGANQEIQPNQTALSYAVDLDRLEIAKLLVKRGASLGPYNEASDTILHHAAQVSKDRDMAEFLLDAGAQIDARTKQGFTPLHIAGRVGNTEIAQLLCDRGAARAKADYGLEPIHMAAAAGQLNMLQLLLSRGVDVEAKAAYSRTPLESAAAAGQLEAVKYLLAHGADLNARDDQAKTPLGIAKSTGHGAVADYLLSAGGKE